MEDWKKNDDEDLDEEDILLRNKCREMSDEELKNIVPVWATNIEKMQWPIYHPAYPGSNCVFMRCNLEKLIEHSSNLDDVVFNKTFDGYWPEESRFARTVNRWLNKEYVDPPILEMKQDDLIIKEGRHRTIMAQYIGVKDIIVCVPQYLIEDMQKLIDAVILETD